jgi:DNA-binding protein H-NS
MPKLSAAALKARIDKLQKQLAVAEASRLPAIKKVRALMAKLGITLADLAEDKTAGRRGRPVRAGSTKGVGFESAVKHRKARGKVAIKYRDEKGNTWTGRGKTPRWLIDGEKSGRSRDAFKIA